MNRIGQGIIKSQMRPESPRMVLNRVAVIRFGTDENQVDIIGGASLSELSEKFYYKISKEVVTGKLHQRLYPVQFDESEFCKSNLGVETHSLIHSILQDGMTDSSTVEKLANRFRDIFDFGSEYAAVLCHFTLTAPVKDKLGLLTDENTDHSFLVMSICPVHRTYGTFRVGDNCDISEVSSSEIHIQPKPNVGFVYPCYDGKSSDINSVALYTRKKSSEVLESLFDVFGTKRCMSCGDEQIAFNELLHDIFGENLNYTIYLKINSALETMLESVKATEPTPTIDAGWMTSIAQALLPELNDEKKAEIADIFKNYYDIHACNIYSPVLNIQTGGFTLRSKMDCADMVQISKNSDGYKLSAFSAEDVFVDKNPMSV